MMKKYLTIVLMALCTVQVAKAQFFDDPMLFPGWNNRSMYRSGLKDLVSMRLGIGATHWNYREKPLKWSANLDLNLYQKFTIGMGVLGENDYYVSIGTDLFSSEGLEIEGGVQRFDFSSQKGFSNLVQISAPTNIVMCTELGDNELLGVKFELTGKTLVFEGLSMGTGALEISVG